MQTVVTSRIDSSLKDRAADILNANGLSVSDAIRQMFEAVVINNTPAFLDNNQTVKQTAKEKIAKLDEIYVHGFENCSDEELQKLRIEDRYAPISGH